MTDRPVKTAESAESDAQWRTAGDRIQTLLDASAAGGAAAYDRAQQLVREVVGLYGAGLERIMQLADPALAERLARDDLAASLLLVHGLHPHDVHRRVSDALDRVRPYLGSHGGDVDLLEIDGDTVRLAFAGSCKSCPSSAVTLELAVEDAVRAAAPEVSSIEVVTASPSPSPSTVIPAESLLAHVHPGRRGATTWHPLPELDELRPGEVAGFLIAGATVVGCRVGEALFAYRDHCPVCDDTLAGAALHDALLVCPRCHTRFDVVRAGVGPGVAHLEPLPLLPRGGVLSVAVGSEAISEAVEVPA